MTEVREATPDPHAGDCCAGCEWERQPHAFRWFPELGAPYEGVRRMSLPGPVDEPADLAAPGGAERARPVSAA